MSIFSIIPTHLWRHPGTGVKAALKQQILRHVGQELFFVTGDQLQKFRAFFALRYVKFVRLQVPYWNCSSRTCSCSLISVQAITQLSAENKYIIKNQMTAFCVISVDSALFLGWNLYFRKENVRNIVVLCQTIIKDIFHTIMHDLSPLFFSFTYRDLKQGSVGSPGTFEIMAFLILVPI